MGNRLYSQDGLPESEFDAPDTEAPKRGQVVVGFDGSAASLDALAFATGWARRTQARITIVHVTDLSWRWAVEACAALAPVTPPDVTTDLFADVADAMADVDLPWTYVATRGCVAQELQRQAKRLKADVVIIGGTRRNGHARKSSVSHRLLNGSDSILVVVP